MVALRSTRTRMGTLRGYLLKARLAAPWRPRRGGQRLRRKRNRKRNGLGERSDSETESAHDSWAENASDSGAESDSCSETDDADGVLGMMSWCLACL